MSRGGVVRDPEARRARRRAVAECARRARRRRCSASPPPGCPGPAGNRETFVWLGEGGRAGALATSRRARGGRRVKAVVRTHRRRNGGSADALSELIGAARRAGATLVLRRRRDPQARLEPAEGIEVVERRPHRRRPLHRARRRRHDPHRAARVRGHGRAGVRGQLRRGRLPRHARPRRAGAGLRPRVRRRVRAPAAADHRRRAPRGHLDRDQRHLRAPQAGHARRRPRLRARGGGDRARALRRARGRHAAGLDGLQPRQRRPDPGLGRARLRRLLHRAALADRARARRRARTTC